MVDEAIDGGKRHGWIGKDLSPLAKWLVCGDQHRALFISGADEFEQHAGLGLVLGDVGEIVEDQEMEFVEPADGNFEAEFASSHLEFLDEIGCTGEQHSPSVLDEGKADG